MTIFGLVRFFILGRSESELSRPTCKLTKRIFFFNTGPTPTEKKTQRILPNSYHLTQRQKKLLSFRKNPAEACSQHKLHQTSPSSLYFPPSALLLLRSEFKRSFFKHKMTSSSHYMWFSVFSFVQKNAEAPFFFFFFSRSGCSGPALGIGRECDGLGPMPLGGPKKNLWRGCI